MSGSVRMVYAIIYSLFLGFGITIGSDLFYLVDPSARRADNLAAAALQQMITIQGSFSQLANDTSPDFVPQFMPFNGSFTFSNSSIDSVGVHLSKGAVICDRANDLPWFQQGMPPIYQILLVPAFSLCLCLWNMQPFRSKELPVQVLIACLGYVANMAANHYIFDRSDVVSAIGAFVIGYVLSFLSFLPNKQYSRKHLLESVWRNGIYVNGHWCSFPSPRMSSLFSKEYANRTTSPVWQQLVV